MVPDLIPKSVLFQIHVYPNSVQLALLQCRAGPRMSSSNIDTNQILLLGPAQTHEDTPLDTLSLASSAIHSLSSEQRPHIQVAFTKLLHRLILTTNTLKQVVMCTFA